MARWWRRWASRRAALVVGAVVVGLVALGAVVVVAGVVTEGGSAVPGSSAEPAIARDAGYGATTGYDGASPFPAPATAWSDATGPDATTESGASGAGPSQATGQGVPVGTVGRSLVRTAQIALDVDDPVTGVQAVRAAAAAAGGTVTQEQSGPSGGWVVLRVPADVLDRTIDDVARLGEVRDRSVSVVDATEEVVDLDARVASQQASVARVRALLAEASSIGDVVAIESELARREAELDSLTSRLAALRDQVALSTLTVDLRGPDAVPLGPDEPVGFVDGLAAGWEGLLAVGRGTGAVVGFLLPFLPVAAAITGVVWALRRLLRGRARARASAADAT